MDILTHLFIPITVAYVLRPDLFPSPRYLLLAVFAVLPDVDKLVGLQGVLHSAITLGLIGAILLSVEQLHRDKMTYATLIIALMFSHLLLDFLDGGPVTILYPLVDVGIGLHYPTEFVIGDSIGTTGITEPIPKVHVNSPNRSRTSYRLVSGYGILSGLTFLVVYFSERRAPSVFSS